MLKILEEQEVKNAVDTLALTEIFASVQGETHLSGLPTTFVRTAACNLRCTWCDTTYSFGRGTSTEITDILETIKKNDTRHVCVTGGEPLLQKSVFPFMKTLCDLGYIVSLETGGSLSIAQVDPRVITILDIKCPGSGMEHKNYWPNLEILRSYDEIKFVLADRHDYEYAKEVIKNYELEARHHVPLLSPVHGILNPQTLVAWMLEDKLRVRLNLQIHKYIWTPTTMGV